MIILVDSNILINFLLDEPNFVKKINEITSRKVPLFISMISIYEVYLGIIANLYLKVGRPSKVPELLRYMKNFY